MKSVFRIIFISLLIVFLAGCVKSEDNKLSIISTSYPGYDFARAVVKNSDIDVNMLLKPGSEIHDFEPTPKDIIKIQNSDIFIYVGGESDEWIEDVLDDIDISKTKIVRLMDLVDIKKESSDNISEKEDDDEYDEHVWTSPVNAIKIIQKIKDEIVKIDSKNEILYEDNTNNYVKELNDIDLEIRDIVLNGKRKELIFGDRFPLRYFTDEYGLSYFAAFPGCSDATEASAKTISFLSKKVREDSIPVVFHIELSSGRVADLISKETGAKVAMFNSAHNISQKDFDSGVTYADIMRKNIDVLREALN